MTPVVVAKVGGSLFDLPDLRQRLLTWASRVEAERAVLVPGGGGAADVVRALDQIHRLGESAAHWLAIRALTVNAHFLATVLGVPVVESPNDSGPSRVAVLEPHAFCRADEGHPGAIEHSWKVTSDAIAARVAAVAGGPLVLLKSVELPDGCTWEDAGSTGFVDEAFADVVRCHALTVQWVNLRRPAFAARR
jgi:aspartokinase-like uncharacterized kinase